MSRGGTKRSMSSRSDAATSRVGLVRAPLRVSLVGGGTDLLSYAYEHGGDAIGFAIDRYVWVAVYPGPFEGGVVTHLDRYEHVGDPSDLRNEFARAVLTGRTPPEGLQVASFSDVPPGTGLGGSAAFLVAMLRALGDDDEPERLAQRASDVEIVALSRAVGRNDHMIAAVGGLCRVRTNTKGEAEVEELAVSSAVRRYIDERLLLFYTGAQRSAGTVLADQDRGTRDRSPKILEALHNIKALTPRLADALRDDDVDQVGPLLHEHWECKRSLSASVSTSRIATLYAAARAAGADGGKLLGAGSGGFLLVSTLAGGQGAVREAMASLGAGELEFAMSAAGVEIMSVGAA